MVEAGGVEPPSEKARREENYVRIRLMSFGGRLINEAAYANCVLAVMFSDRFTGARNPARLPTTIRSRRIRYAPISSSASE